MLVQPDFAEVQEFEELPEGTYSVRVTSVEQKVSQKGSAYLNWELTVFGAEGDFEKFNNRKFFTITMLEGPGAGRLQQFYRCAKGEKLAGGFDTDDLLGCELQAVVHYETDRQSGERKQWPSVKTYLPMQ